jgi:starch-binding outer membrane protein, SusD/RagB family
MKIINYNKIAPLVALALATVTMVGCDKDLLSPVPQTTLSDASAFQSASRIQQQVFGVYSAIKSGQFLGGRAHVYQDVRGEEWVNVTTNGVTALGVWNFSVTDGDNQVENYWSAGYAAINRANVVLEGIDANPTVITAATANAYRGEVRFCRALSYFYLQSLYARRPFNADAGASLSVPLRLTANKSPEGAALARSTQAQIFTQILDDLNFAEANLPATYGSAGDSNVARAHKNAAIAMKMRVYMHMNRWADVITEGNKIVSAAAPFQSPINIVHRLNPAVLTTFRTYTTPESIFSMPMAVTNSPGGQNGLGQYWTAEFGLINTGIISNTGWMTADARRTNFITPASGSNPARWTKFNDDLNNYVPILRYAEVMLNLAEALARQSAGVDARALALLNAVRQRSDATVTFAPASKDELIGLILTERRIELLGEGFRSLDIMRQNITFPAKGSVGSVPTSSVSYVWPIPASEMLLNSLMVRNQ